MCSFKSALTTVKKLIMILMVLHFLHDSKNDAYGQVNITSSGNITDCTKDLRASTDKYTFKGTVDGSVNLISPYVNFQIKRGSASFALLCPIDLSICSAPNTLACYCAANRSNVFEIVANRTATIIDSNALVRIQWVGSSTVSSNEVPLPKILDVNSVTTLITINDQAATFPANIKYSSVIKFICENSPSPCKITLFLDNNIVAQGDDAIKYQVNSPILSNISHEIVFSYSICGGPTSNVSGTFNIDQFPPETSTAALTNLTTTTTTMNTDTTVPTSNSTSAALVTPSCSLNCKDWAIALSVIYYIGIIIIIATGTTILALSIRADKKTVILYICIGLLLFAEILDIILIIIFAQADPCTCDPEPGRDLALWKIMLIIFCIVDGLLIIATVAELIWNLVFAKKKENINGNNSRSAVITPATVSSSTPNKISAREDKSGRNVNSLSKEKEKSENTEDQHKRQKTKQALSNTVEGPKKDLAENQVSNQSSNKNSKGKKSHKNIKKGNAQVKESSPTNLPLTDLQISDTTDKNLISNSSEASTVP